MIEMSATLAWRDIRYHYQSRCRYRYYVHVTAYHWLPPGHAAYAAAGYATVAAAAVIATRTSVVTLLPLRCRVIATRCCCYGYWSRYAVVAIAMAAIWRE